MHMGVAVRITLFAPDRSVAENRGRRAFARFAGLDQTMSDFIQTSELGLLVARAGEGPVSVSQDLFDVLSLAHDLALASDGAFDVTAAPATHLWRAALRTGKPPSLRKIDTANRMVGPNRMRLDARSRTVALDPGTRLDLGAIGKGYACDQALAELTRCGSRSAMVEAGGDLAVSGAPPGTGGWRVALDEEGLDVVTLAHRAVSTSGGSVQSFEHEGVTYSHVVDPRTGRALTHGRQTTAIGTSCAVTDALATLANVDPIAARLVAERYGASVIRPSRTDAPSASDRDSAQCGEDDE